MRYFPRNSIILCHFFVSLFWGAKKDTKLSLYSVFMATTVKILFDRKAKASKTSNGTVEIEVYSDGVRRRYSTGVRVRKDQWYQGRVVNHPAAVELNTRIQELYERYMRVTSDTEFSIEKLSNPNKKPSISFIDWMEAEIDRRKDIRPNTIRSHKSTLHILQEWGVISSFKHLTLKNITAFDEYLHKRLNKQSAIHAHHKALKVYINRGIIQGLISESPYAGVKISRGKTEARKFLSEDQRAAIESLSLVGMAEFVKDMFLLACYTGLAYADIIRISKDDVRQSGDSLWLIDKRQKTGTQYKLMLLPEAEAILGKYEYNMDRITNQKANMYLKGIAAAAGITENLTMHMGRHTFATWALNKGVPIEVVSKMLAHSDITTTQIYAKVLQQEVDKGFELLKKK